MNSTWIYKMATGLSSFLDTKGELTIRENICTALYNTFSHRFVVLIQFIAPTQGLLILYATEAVKFALALSFMNMTSDEITSNGLTC